MQKNGRQDPQSPCCIEHVRLRTFIVKCVCVCVCVCVCLSRVRLFVTPWAVAHQSPLSMQFSRQEQWSGLACPSAGYPDPGIEPWSPALHTDSLLSEPPGRIYRQNAVEISQAALTLKPVTFKISCSCM